MGHTTNEPLSSPLSITVVPAPIDPELMAQTRIENIETLVLRCVICGGPVPARRATSRSKDTCGPECHKVLRAFRKYVVLRTKCPTCFHPSSPHERKLYLEWRKATGQRRATAGRPPQKLRQSLEKAITLLREYLAPEDAFLGSQIAGLQQALDSDRSKS